MLAAAPPRMALQQFFVRNLIIGTLLLMATLLVSMPAFP